LDLRPFAVDHAVWLWNRMPNKATKLSPMEQFTRTAFTNYHHLKRRQVFGCPTFVLDHCLQDGEKLPKWTRRSRRGLNLEYSPEHSTTVSRVLNVDGGKVSPPYHCVHGDAFTSVTAPDESSFDTSEWENLLAVGHERNWEPLPE
jgi:hypothetical protein